LIVGYQAALRQNADTIDDAPDTIPRRPESPRHTVAAFALSGLALSERPLSITILDIEQLPRLGNVLR
jgi:hypothetical protein